MNITGIARENFEEAGLPLKNTIELTTKNEYTIPDIWGLKVEKISGHGRDRISF